MTEMIIISMQQKILKWSCPSMGCIEVGESTPVTKNYYLHHPVLAPVKERYLLTHNVTLIQ